MYRASFLVKKEKCFFIARNSRTSTSSTVERAASKLFTFQPRGSQLTFRKFQLVPSKIIAKHYIYIIHTVVWLDHLIGLSNFFDIFFIEKYKTLRVKCPELGTVRNWGNILYRPFTEENGRRASNRTPQLS